jgi:hypothetical protein
VNQPQSAIAPPIVADGEPAVIRRLPNGIDYTHIKAIFINLPSPLTTALWCAPSNSRLIAAFKGRTIRAIDRALRREAQGSPDAAAVRHELVALCLYEANHSSSPHPERRISVTHVFPNLFDEAHRPPGPSVPHIRLTVRSVAPRRHHRRASTAVPEVLEERVIASEPAAWDPSIPFIDPKAFDLAVLELLRKHFPRMLGVRVGARWRSEYSPEGWKLVTQHVVPRLYEFLRPFYAVRRYRRSASVGPAHYAARLRRDITDIIRFELPVARRLTVERVTAAIQRHVARQRRSQRPRKVKRPKQ